jgi:large subunit ribosomal protein L23
MKLSDVLKRPIITEKAAGQTAEQKYVFEVDRRSTKEEIKKAVEKFFKVKPLKIRTIMARGKKHRALRTRKESQKADWKKAIVLLKEGDKIDLFETEK